MSRRRRWAVGAAVAVACGMGWVGCGDSGGSEPPPPAPAPSPQTGALGVRVVHAAPAVAPVDVYVQGNATPIATNLGYGQASPYAQLAPGTYVLELRPTGAAPTSPATVTTAPQELAANTRVTAIAAGLATSTDPADSLRVLWLPEGFAQAGPDEIRMRIVHAGADAPAIGVDVGDDGTLELEGLERFQFTTPEGGALPAATDLPLGIFISPTDRVTGFVIPGLPAGTNVFAIATGLAALPPEHPESFSMLVVGPEGVINLVKQNPFLFVLHAAPDAGPVDVFVGEQEILDNVLFSELSPAMQAQPGNYTVDVFPHAEGSTRPTGAPVLSSALPPLVAGGSYLAGATGLTTRPDRPLSLQVVTRGFAVDPANARVRVIHWSPDAPAVDIGLVTGGTFTRIPELTGLTYPNASAPEGVVLPPGAQTIGVAPTGGDPIAQVGVTVAAAQALFAVAIGVIEPGSTAEPFRLLIIDATTIPWVAATAPAPSARAPILVR